MTSSDTKMQIHAEKSNPMRGPGVCANGCHEWFVCENNTERIKCPDNVEILAKLHAYAKEHAEEGFELNVHMSFFETRGFEVSIKEPRGYRSYAQSTCEFEALRNAAQLFLARAKETVEIEDKEMSDKIIQCATEFWELARGLRCGVEHQQALVAPTGQFASKSLARDAWSR